MTRYAKQTGFGLMGAGALGVLVGLIGLGASIAPDTSVANEFSKQEFPVVIEQALRSDPTATTQGAITTTVAVYRPATTAKSRYTAKSNKRYGAAATTQVGKVPTRNASNPNGCSRPAW